MEHVDSIRLYLLPVYDPQKVFKNLVPSNGARSIIVVDDGDPGEVLRADFGHFELLSCQPSQGLFDIGSLRELFVSKEIFKVPRIFSQDGELDAVSHSDAGTQVGFRNARGAKLLYGSLPGLASGGDGFSGRLERNVQNDIPIVGYKPDRKAVAQ